MRTAVSSRVPVRLVPAPLRTVLLLVSLAMVHLACAPGAAQRHAPPLNEQDGGWQQVARGELGTLYIDTASVETIDDQVLQVRTRWHFSHPQHESNGREYSSSVAVRAVDCRSGRLTILAFANYDGAGTTHTASQPLFAAQWDQVRAKSPSASIVEAACSGPRGARLAEVMQAKEAP